MLEQINKWKDMEEKPQLLKTNHHPGNGLEAVGKIVRSLNQENFKN
jgi:hypothetical protein